jgi:hypothetical protein
MRNRRLVLFIIIMFSLGLVDRVWAQAQAPDGEQIKYGSEWSGFVGHMLPSQIRGVTEILPVFGFRYGLPTIAGVIEAGASNTHAEGVDFTTASLSLRNEFDLVEHFAGIFYLGGDFHYYRPTYQANRLTAVGGHFGGGLMMHISSTLWFRTELISSTTGSNFLDDLQTGVLGRHDRVVWSGRRNLHMLLIGKRIVDVVVDAA